VSVQILTQRIAQIIRAYAAGDAYGVQYEFKPPASIVVREELVEVDGWPAGGVSDDTLLSLMTLEAFIDSPDDADAAAANFLARLAAAKPNLRGLGPTTRAALGMEVKPEEKDMVGRSNGGVMRCALLGLALADHHERRTVVSALTRATHSHDRAVAAALVGSRLISDAIELGAASDIDAAVHDESPEFAAEILGFVPSAEGVTLDPIETIGAAISAAKSADDASGAFMGACRFGGDTDTTAALAGSIYMTRHPVDNGLESISWLGQVEWDEIPQLQAVAAGLAQIRLAR
jgi:ADP-ribosylglycohydrolase